VFGDDQRGVDDLAARDEPPGDGWRLRCGLVVDVQWRLRLSRLTAYSNVVNIITPGIVADRPGRAARTRPDKEGADA
jgi:hypothetical protein